METQNLAILLPLIGLLLVAGIFIGSITGQAVRGETEDFSTAELTIAIIAIILLAELTIVTILRKKKKETTISEIITEAQGNMY